MFELKEKEEAEHITDPRDGQEYRIVTIGSQTWMAENLNYKTEEGSKYYNDDNSYALFGRIYSRDAAMNACPDGWHLPLKDEWIQLGTQVGLTEDNIYGYVEIYKLKSKHAWIDDPGTDDYGFSIIPGAYALSDCCNLERASFWSSTLETDWTGDTIAIIFGIMYNSSIDWSSLKLSDYRYYSIRCIKD
jgi:uncharacterized protein (TIGR02145 family)